MSYAPRMFDPIWCVEGENDREIRDRFGLAMDGVDIVCASATYDALYPTLELLREARRLNPDVTTILGGPHADEVHSIPEHNPRRGHASPVDFLVAGDGEWALLALLRAIATEQEEELDLSEVPGKTYVYTPWGVRLTNGQPLNLDELPYMPLAVADRSRHQNDFDIFKEGGRILPTVQMIASRGCAYSCEFCSERRDLAYPTARSIDNILAEIELRKQQGFRAVFFDDSTFGLYPRLHDLLRALRGTGMVFGCLNRFNHLVKPSILAEYREAGFVYFYCAIEQFDDGALQQMKKAQNTACIERSMQLLDEFGFSLGVSLLYGLPYETERSIQKTLDFAADWVSKGLIRLVSESVLSFHPGTPAGRREGLQFDRPPPNRGVPFSRFEEGQWFHHPHVTAHYLKRILAMSERRFGHVMVRNRHSWYARKGLTKPAA